MATNKKTSSKSDWTPQIEPKVGDMARVYDYGSGNSVEVEITEVTKKLHHVKVKVTSEAKEFVSKHFGTTSCMNDSGILPLWLQSNGRYESSLNMEGCPADHQLLQTQAPIE